MKFRRAAKARGGRQRGEVHAGQPTNLPPMAPPASSTARHSACSSIIDIDVGVRR